jgi:hypothetical protein
LVSFVLETIAWAFSCKLERECRDRSRSVSETYRPLALARLYGESWIFMVNFVSAVEEDFLRFLGNREAVEPNFPLKKTKFYVDETKFSITCADGFT